MVFEARPVYRRDMGQAAPEAMVLPGTECDGTEVAGAEAAGTVAAAGSHIPRTVVSGFGWKLLSQVTDQAARTIVALVLARLLSPRDFGLAGMAFVFTGIAFIFTDLSLGAALVQRKEIDERDRSTVFWTTSAFGLLCTIVGILASGSIARLFSEPAVKPLFMVISVTFVLIALSATQASLLTRDLAFRSLELREIVATLTSAVVAIALAASGFGVWAIIAQAVTMSSTSLIMLWSLSSWRPKFVFSFHSLRTLGGFGLKMFGSRLFGWVNLNADNLLVGKFLGPSSLGVYSVAYNVMLAPLSRITMPMGQVLFPALSQMQDDVPRVARGWLQTTKICAAVAVPAFLGMIIVAPDLVPVVLGSRWHETVPVLQLLCVAGLATFLQPIDGSLLQARGRAGTVLRFTAFSSVLNLTAFAVGLRWGIIGVAGCFAVSRTLLMPVNVLLACQSVGVSLREFVRNLSGVMEAALMLTIAVAAARNVLVAANVPPAARLVALIALGIAVYGLALLLRDREIIAEARRLRAA
jgi:O-antigen/teichoic acid export membrane protein